MQKSKLEIILNSLANRQDINIVAIEEKRYYSKSDFQWSHIVNIIIAPPETELNFAKLQNLMTSLVPKIDPSKAVHFSKKVFFEEFGYLVFRETVEVDFSGARYVNNPNHHEVDRQITIHLAPNEEVGKIIFNLLKGSAIPQK